MVGFIYLVVRKVKNLWPGGFDCNSFLAEIFFSLHSVTPDQSS